MSLVNFSVISPSIELGDLLSSLDTVIPQQTIAQAIEQSNMELSLMSLTPKLMPKSSAIREPEKEPKPPFLKLD